MDVHVRTMSSTVRAMDSRRPPSPETIELLAQAVAERLARDGVRTTASGGVDARVTSGPDFGDELEER